MRGSLALAWPNSGEGKGDGGGGEEDPGDIMCAPGPSWLAENWAPLARAARLAASGLPSCPSWTHFASRAARGPPARRAPLVSKVGRSALRDEGSEPS